MPVFVNGRKLGVERNGIFDSSNTDPIPGGKLWTDAAAAWNAARAAFIEDGGNPWDFVPVGPAASARTYAQQVVLKNVWVRAGQPQKAAAPGTSNHGWGIAVDVKTQACAAWLMIHGAKFGWSHDEGARVGEWWHFRYVGGYKPKVDRLAHLTATERRWCRELDDLRRRRRDPQRQRVLVRELTQQRKRIYRDAQHGGWDKRNRRRRYRSLLARTK